MNKKTILLSLGLSFGLILGAEKDSITPSATFVHPDAAGKLPLIGNVAIVLAGVDKQTNQLLEDGVALLLLSESIKVVYPGEREIGKEREVPAEPIDFARKINANCLVTGRVVARCGHCRRGKGHCPNNEIRALSLSLIDVPQDKVLVWALYEPDDKGPVEICRSFVSFMLNSLKEPDEKKQKEKQ
jgi:hypothetical protein